MAVGDCGWVVPEVWPDLRGRRTGPPAAASFSCRPSSRSSVCEAAAYAACAANETTTRAARPPATCRPERCTGHAPLAHGTGLRDCAEHQGDRPVIARDLAAQARDDRGH